MGDYHDTPVSLCPACRASTPGIVKVCPACGHRFAAGDAGLPMARDSTAGMATTRVQEQLQARKPRLGRQVAVPFLAGLLLALMVAVATQVFDYGSRTSRDEPHAPAAVAVAAHKARPAPPPVVFDSSTEKVKPTHAGLVGESRESSGARAAAVLLDGDPRTCMAAAVGKGEGVEFNFDAPRRFSHVTMVVGCLDHQDAAATMEAVISTEDGARRYVRIPAVNGTLWVDLAGAWSSRVTFGFAAGDAPHIGLGEVEFFAFPAR